MKQQRGPVLASDARRRPSSTANVARTSAARPSRLRLQHVALNVSDLGACERFYVDILGLRVVWRPDSESVYLTNGSDNLALHHAPVGPPATPNRLDHIGFALENEAAVDAWHVFMAARGVPIVAAPRTHRDGSRSLYCQDPDGNSVQLLYEPRLEQ